ncbi:MAG: hypothetical protein LBI42_09515 [Chitinispirillales bacterium]|nr:hypothetical protein [Chitinispirillales bacterium]
MKKKWSIGFFLLLLILLILSSCITCYSLGIMRFGVFKYDIPYGEWKSNDPDITLYITSKMSEESIGTYNKDGDVKKIFITFMNSPGFIIQGFDAQYYDESRDKWLTRGDRFYFRGKFKRKGNKLYYYAQVSNGLGFQESYEEKTIVFELIKEYNVAETIKRDVKQDRALFQITFKNKK